MFYLVRSYKLILFILLGANSLFAQQRGASPETFTTKNKKAILLYKQGANYLAQRLVVEAEILLKQAIDKDENFAEPYFMLAQLSKFTMDNASSKKYYEKGLSLQPDNPKFSIFYFDVAEIYLKDGDYENAEVYAKKFVNNKNANPKYKAEALKIIGDCSFAKEAIKNPIPFTPKQLPDYINSNYLQYFPSVTVDGNTLVFTSSNSFSLVGNEDLMVTQKLNDSTWSKPGSISPKINSTRENEGTASISGDGKTLVFTACGRRDSKGNCDLYISNKVGNEWSSPINMGATINSNDWDSQPSLSADGRTLFFVSMRRGGLGEADIYMSSKDQNNEWSTPANLGEGINTSGNESSPFIHANSTTLYYSTNGKPSMGGQDIYMTERVDSVWTEPRNLGYPINTSKDDQGLVINADFSKGYYNSDIIKNNKQLTVLFEFEIPSAIKGKTQSSIAKGTVSDAVSHKKLASQIELIDLSNGVLVSTVYSDEINGDYTLVLNDGKEYALYCSKKGYLFKSMSFNYTNKKEFNALTLDIELEPIKKGAHIVLNNIFFESAKYELQDKSTTELKRLIAFFKANPYVKVEVSGHTDNIGNRESNQKLSTQRAQSVFNYLVKNGIPSTSIVCKGYGDSKPVVPNTSDENRQLNRRIEFMIIE